MTKKTPKTVLFTEISYEDFEEFLNLHLDNIKELMENLDPRTLMPDDRHLYIDTIYAQYILHKNKGSPLTKTYKDFLVEAIKLYGH